MSLSGRGRKLLLWLLAIALVVVVLSVVFGCAGGHGEGGLQLGPITTTK